MDILEQIPYTIANGIENMAQDVAMLQHGGDRDSAMWRLYGWNEPAITFGYSQKWMEIQGSLMGFEGICIRRITGGGIVDHRNDLTYALSLPACHPYYRVHAQVVYEGLHELIAGILLGMGFPSQLAPCDSRCGKSMTGEVSVCFQAPEPYDVINSINGRKQAGAAMKRNRSGLLVQGSLSLDALPGLDPVEFGKAFGPALAAWLKLSTKNCSLLPETLLQAERERFSSGEWNRRR